MDQFYGIEIEEFAAHIAEAAMWLVDHQMNMKLADAFGQVFLRLPLKKSAHIIHGNALQLDWKTVIAPEKLSYMLGNPPFIGNSYQTTKQKEEINLIFSGVQSHKMLDYVAAWYWKAAQYIQNTTVSVAFVSTNSITQGEQAGLLWQPLLNHYGIRIHFAHRTFKWTIDEKKAKGMKIAAVHCVIIGFSASEITSKYLFDYETITSEPHRIAVKNINPYLVEGVNATLQSVNTPLCSVPKMQSGSAARDGGFLLFSEIEKNQIIADHPQTSSFFRKFISGDDFLNGKIRWCLWLKNISSQNFRDISAFQERFKSVKTFRNDSTRAGTKKMADLPYLFAEERQPTSDFLLIP